MSRIRTRSEPCATVAGCRSFSIVFFYSGRRLIACWSFVSPFIARVRLCACQHVRVACYTIRGLDRGRYGDQDVRIMVD